MQESIRITPHLIYAAAWDLQDSLIYSWHALEILALPALSENPVVSPTLKQNEHKTWKTSPKSAKPYFIY